MLVEDFACIPFQFTNSINEFKYSCIEGISMLFYFINFFMSELLTVYWNPKQVLMQSIKHIHVVNLFSTKF